MKLKTNKKKKKAGGGSGKGGEFEREFSKLFSDYLTGGARNDVFWRSSQSGGRATTRAKTGLKTAGSYGDITCLDASFAFITRVLCFELKRGYNTVGVLDLLDGKKAEPEIIAFWKQCSRDAELGGIMFPFVVLRRDFRNAVIIIPRKLHNLFSRKVGSRKYNRIDIDYDALRITVIKLDDFLSGIPIRAFLGVIQDCDKELNSG
jgi:hypothetical protein